MITYTKTNTGLPRTNTYRFTAFTRLCQEIEALRETVRETNKYEREVFEHKKYFNKDASLKQYFVRVRPRGPRNGNLYDTPPGNATRYDVYVAEKTLY